MDGREGGRQGDYIRVKKGGEGEGKGGEEREGVTTVNSHIPNTHISFSHLH